MLAPRHLRNVDETLNARGNLNECTVVGNDNNLTLDVIANLELAVESIPRMRSELLQAESNALLLIVEVENDNIDLLVESNNLMRIADAAPREVCDVDESVNTAEIDEYTIRGDVLNGTLKNLTLLELRDDLALLSFELSLDESLVGNNNVAELLIDLHNLELHGLAHEYVVVADGVHVDLAAGQECLDTKHVDDHATLRAALDEASDNFLVVESSVDTLPALRQTGFLVRENELALLVLCIFYVDFHNVTHLQVGVVAELRSGDDTIALVADVDNNFLLVDSCYSTINNLMVGYLVKCFVVSFLKLFAAYA